MSENETIPSLPILKYKSIKVKNDQIIHDTNELPDLSSERYPEAKMKKVNCVRAKQETTVWNEMTLSDYVDQQHQQPYNSQQTPIVKPIVDFTVFDLKTQKFKPIHGDYTKEKLTQQHQQPYNSQQTPIVETIVDFTVFDLKTQKFKPIHGDYTEEKLTNKLKQKCRITQTNKRQNRRTLENQTYHTKPQTSGNINYLKGLNICTNKICPELEHINDTCTHPNLFEEFRNKGTNKDNKRIINLKLSTCTDKTPNIDKIDSTSVCRSKKQLNSVPYIDNIEPSLNLSEIYNEPHIFISKNIESQNNIVFDRSRELTKKDNLNLKPEICKKQQVYTNKCPYKEKNKDNSSDLMASIIGTNKNDLETDLHVLPPLSVPKSVPNETYKKENESSECQSINERGNVKVINDTKKMPTVDVKTLLSLSADEPMKRHVSETNYQINLYLEPNIIKTNYIHPSNKIKEYEQAECIYEFNVLDENSKAYDLDYIQSINQTEERTLTTNSIEIVNVNQHDSEINQDIENLAFTQLKQTNTERHLNKPSIQTTIDSTTDKKYVVKAQTEKLTNIEESTTSSYGIEKKDLTTNANNTSAVLEAGNVKPLSMKLHENTNLKRNIENSRKYTHLSEIDLQEASYNVNMETIQMKKIGIQHHLQSKENKMRLTSDCSWNLSSKSDVSTDINKLKRKHCTPIEEEPIISNNEIKPVVYSRSWKQIESSNEPNKTKKKSNLRMQSIRSTENNVRTANKQMRPVINWNSNLGDHESKNYGRNSSIFIHNLQHNLIKAGTRVDYAPMTTSLAIEQKTSIPMFHFAIAPTAKSEIYEMPPINWNSISTPPDQYWNMHSRSSWLYPTSTETLYRPRAIHPSYRKQIQDQECNVRIPYSGNCSVVSRTGYIPSKFIYPSNSTHPTINTKMLNSSSMYANKNYCCSTSFSRDSDKSSFESLDTSSANESHVHSCQNERNNSISKPTFSNNIKNINCYETQNFSKRNNNESPPMEFIQDLDDITIEDLKLFDDINPRMLKEYLIDDAISTFDQDQSNDNIMWNNNYINNTWNNNCAHDQNLMNSKEKVNIIPNRSRSPYAQENSSESTTDNSPYSDMNISDIPSITVQRISDRLEDILSSDQSADNLYRMLTENEGIDFSP